MASPVMRFLSTTDMLGDYNTGVVYSNTCMNMTGPMQCTCTKGTVTGAVMDQFNFSSWKYVGDAIIGADPCTQWIVGEPNPLGSATSVTKATPTVLRRVVTNVTGFSRMVEDMTDTEVGPAPASTWILPKQWDCAHEPLLLAGQHNHVQREDHAAEYDGRRSTQQHWRAAADLAGLAAAKARELVAAAALKSS
jgi:hypothetical protein